MKGKNKMKRRGKTMPNQSHIRNQLENHPQKNSKIGGGPITNPNDIEAIMQLLDSNPRNYLLFIMGINCALRVKELLKLKAGSFREVREGEEILIPEKNKGEYWKVFINEPIKKALERYFAQFKPDDEQPLFKSQRGEVPICVSVVNAMIKSWCKEKGLKGNYGSSTLRKTYGYTLHREQTNIVIISKRFHHASPARTQSYLDIPDDEGYDVPLKYMTIEGGKAGRAMKNVIMRSKPRDAMKKIFDDYIQSEEWKVVTKKVFERYKGVCQGQDCGITEKNGKNGKVKLIAHHERYDNWAKANDDERADCILLCKRCHDQRHSEPEMKQKVPFWAQRKYEREYM
jgi:5-methylcytosine-specific restriction endonuclease McrA